MSTPPTATRTFPIPRSILKMVDIEFGNFIDGVFMQEVPTEEQPLYSRLVVHSASPIPVVLNGKSKANFHQWEACLGNAIRA
ncbi:hypothetical protein GBA52_007038 [Prunus armeniaca]|nr:hypothetical protein GBA52_007038 [Prunus armeniaca]